MTTDTFVKAELALLCWRNAANRRALQELKCLAFITRNRQRAGWHGGDWIQLIANDPVYSAYLPSSAAKDAATAGEAVNELDALTRLYPDTRDDIWQRFLWEVDRIYEGTSGDPMTEGALWWAELDKANRPWFIEKIVRRPEDHPRVAQVGPLTLFR